MITFAESVWDNDETQADKEMLFTYVLENSPIKGYSVRNSVRNNLVIGILSLKGPWCSEE